MKRVLAATSIVLVLLLTSAVATAAKDRPHEGKITSIDRAAQTITVQGEKGDEWILHYSEATKMKNNLTAEELRVGDSVHFDFVNKDGRMDLTELHRTHKAK